MRGASSRSLSSSGRQTPGVDISGGCTGAARTEHGHEQCCDPKGQLGPDQLALISGDTRLTTIDCPPSLAWISGCSNPEDNR